MNLLSLASPRWLTLVSTLLHTLWQGALVAAAVWLLLRFVPVRYTRLRYAAACGGLLAILTAGLTTWAWLDRPQDVPALAQEQSTASVQTSPALEAEMQPAAPRPSSNSPVAAPNLSLHWPHWIVLLWIAGVSVCVARTVRQTAGAGRIRERATPLIDTALLALADELRLLLRVAPCVRLMVSAQLQGPAVMGILRPVILLPTSMLTGIPSEAWRAIIAHELAHIRRWDYLVNLLQMLVESLLFFNPFVWWISRQVRQEREACCDQVAAEACSSPSGYFQALVAVLEHAQPGLAPAPLLAASGPGGARSGSVLERAQRLLVPGYLPSLRLRWFSLLLVVTLAGLALAGAWRGTRALAQTLRPPAEEKAKPFTPSEMIELPVSTEDGVPIPKGVAMAYGTSVSSRGNADAAARVAEDGTVYLSVSENADSFSLAATLEGYAPEFLGPLVPPVQAKLKGLELKFTRGFSASVQLQDETGRPILNGRIQAFYPGPPSIDGTRLTSDALATTDATGTATLHHLSSRPPHLRIRADGFQTEEVANLPLDPAKASRVTLKKAQPLPGVVLNEAGQPVEGARVKLAGVRGRFNETYYDPTTAPVQTTTDAQGRFHLTTLRPDSVYYFFVDAPGFGGAYLQDVKTAAGELKVTLGPELMIRGKLTHVPPEVIHLGKIHLNYGQTFPIGENFAGQATLQHPLQEGGDYTFALGPFYVPQGKPAAERDKELRKKSITVAVDRYSEYFSIDELPLTDYALDLKPRTAAEGMRCTGRIVQEDGTPLSWDGARVAVRYEMPEVNHSQSSGESIAFFTPEGRFTASINAKAAKVIVLAQKAGYAPVWLGPLTPPLDEKVSGLRIPLSAGFTAKIQLINENGQPVSGAGIKARYPGPPGCAVVDATTDADGALQYSHLAKAPLEVTISAAGYQEERFRDVLLDPAQPTRWVLKKAWVLPGQVTDAATGQPIAGAKIKLHGRRGPVEDTYSDPDTAPLLAESDAQGRFTLGALRADSTYYFFVEAPGHGGVLVDEVKIGHPAANVALGPELIVRGKLVNVPPDAIHNGAVSLGSNQYFQIGTSSHATSKNLLATLKDGEFTFTTGPLYAWPVVFQYGGLEDPAVEPKDFSRSDLVLDYTQRPATK